MSVAALTHYVGSDNVFHSSHPFVSCEKSGLKIIKSMWEQVGVLIFMAGVLNRSFRFFFFFFKEETFIIQCLEVTSTGVEC